MGRQFYQKKSTELQFFLLRRCTISKNIKLLEDYSTDFTMCVDQDLSPCVGICRPYARENRATSIMSNHLLAKPVANSGASLTSKGKQIPLPKEMDVVKLMENHIQIYIVQFVLQTSLLFGY